LNLASVLPAAQSAGFAMREGLPSTLGWRAEGIREFPLPTSAGPLGARDAAATTEVARVHRADWLVVDTYDASDTYLEMVQAAAPGLLVIDDLAERALSTAHLVVNPTPEAERLGYTLAGGVLLSGPAHALLHPAFAVRRKASLARRSNMDAPETGLVVMGGSDAAGISDVACRALLSAGVHRVRLVLGPAAAAEVRPRDGLEVHVSQSPAEMAEHMAWADIAIATPSTIAWELATLGVPSVLVVVADNQSINARVLRASGACTVCDRPEDLPGAVADLFALSPDARKALFTRWSELGDGRGARRVYDAMRSASPWLNGSDIADNDGDGDE